MAFDGRIRDAITAAKGRNAKAIAALLDVDALRASKNQETDIRAALEALKKDNGYLFESETPPPPIPTGPARMAVGTYFDSFEKSEKTCCKVAVAELYIVET